MNADQLWETTMNPNRERSSESRSTMRHG
ncbi:hypothetical protein QNN00_17035 [Bacillus velezensis]|nr:hypothetical protein [Bacillus velezensis]